MNAKPIRPPEELFVSDATAETLDFELTRYEYGPHENEWGDREVVDVTRWYSARIIQPELGKVISARRDSIAAWGHEHKNELYAVFQQGAGYYAVRTEAMLGDHSLDAIEVRGVALEKAQPTLAWEVYGRTGAGAWVPIAGQHLQSRTAPAGAWLVEVEDSILPALNTREAELVGRLRQHIETSGQRLGFVDEPLDQATAVSRARDWILNCDFDEAHSSADAAESRYQAATTNLESHQEVCRQLGPVRHFPWFGIQRWRIARQCRKEVKDAQEVSIRAQDMWRALQQRANDPKTREQIEQKAQEMMEQRILAQTLNREAKEVAGKILEATELAAYLRRRQGSHVTLEQTLIQGRRLEDVPRIRNSEGFAQQKRATFRMRI